MAAVSAMQSFLEVAWFSKEVQGNKRVRGGGNKVTVLDGNKRLTAQ